MESLSLLSSLSDRNYILDDSNYIDIEKDIEEEHNADKDNEDFIASRLEMLDRSLNDNKIVVLSGKTGSGKTSFVQLLNKSSEHKIKIYDEFSLLSAIEQAKLDPSNLYTVMFDEANIDLLESNYSKFSTMLYNDNPQILLDNNIVDIPSNLRVLFVMNPLEDKEGNFYNGGRVEHKIFSDPAVKHITFNQMSESYIYNSIIKPNIFDELNLENFSEESFQAIFKKNILDYKDKKLSIQNLYNSILFESLIASNSNFPLRCSDIISSNYITLPETEEIQLKIEQMLYLSKNNIKSNRGVLIEGDTGSGKSSLIEATLQHNGYQMVDIGDNKVVNSYIKIPASLSFAKQKEYLKYAVDNGLVVIMDELNSYSNNGIEKYLNAILNNQNPFNNNEEISNNRTIIISSVNDARNLEGRNLLSHALKMRFSCSKSTAIRDYSDESLLKLIQHIAPNPELDYKSILLKARNINNIRDLKSYLSSQEQEFKHVTENVNLIATKKPKQLDNRENNHNDEENVRCNTIPQIRGCII